MKRIFTALAILFLVNEGLQAQTVTYAKDIAPIIYLHCTECHRPGEIGPFPLMNYTDVSNWGIMIKHTTANRFMPPYQADPAYSSFLDENYLTDEQIQKIATWVDNGMPYGDPKDEPLVPDFPDGSQMGTPDMVLTFKETHTHRGTNKDDYRIFVLPTSLTQDKQVIGVELRPGNTRIVHHALFSWDTSGVAAYLDSLTPEYGYTHFGSFGNLEWDLHQYPSYAPGVQQRFLPDGTGQFLPKNSDFLVQMHYAPTPVDEDDSTTINLFFADQPVERQVYQYIMLPWGSLSEPFIIPANEIKTFHGTFNVPTDISLVSIFPHMHLLGYEWEIFAIHPNGDTTNLISIPEWDFNWQGYFNYPSFIKLETGSVIHGFATYDNTTGNPYNPNNPPKDVDWGELTTDEMYYLGFNYTIYKAGDENITFPEDKITLEYPFGTSNGDQLKYPENKLYPIYPNPADQNIVIGVQIAQPSKVRMSIYDINGRLIDTINESEVRNAGVHNFDYNTTHLPVGNYVIEVQAADFIETQQFSVTR